MNNRTLQVLIEKLVRDPFNTEYIEEAARNIRREGEEFRFNLEQSSPITALMTYNKILEQGYDPKIMDEIDNILPRLLPYLLESFTEQRTGIVCSELKEGFRSYSRWALEKPTKTTKKLLERLEWIVKVDKNSRANQTGRFEDYDPNIEEEIIERYPEPLSREEEEEAERRASLNIEERMYQEIFLEKNYKPQEIIGFIKGMQKISDEDLYDSDYLKNRVLQRLSEEEKIQGNTIYLEDDVDLPGPFKGTMILGMQKNNPKYQALYILDHILVIGKGKRRVELRLDDRLPDLEIHLKDHTHIGAYYDDEIEDYPSFVYELKGLIGEFIKDAVLSEKKEIGKAYEELVDKTQKLYLSYPER